MQSLYVSSGHLPRQCALPSKFRQQQPLICYVRHAAYVSHNFRGRLSQLPSQFRYHVFHALSNDEEEDLEEFEEELASDDEDEDEDEIISSDPADWVEVGVVGPPHGVRGEFKMQPLTDFPEERLGEPGPRWLQAPPPKLGKLSSRSPPEAIELEWGRTTIYKGRELWIVKLEGIDSPEEAQLVRGHVLLIPAATRDPLDDEDEFYVQELVGLKVLLDSSGEEVGKVVDLFDGTGTHDVLRIELDENFGVEKAKSEGSEEDEVEEKVEEAKKNGSGGGGGGGKRQVMLPFVKALVPIVNVEQGFMRVDPPTGLFDLAVEATVKQKRNENAGKRERRNSRPTRYNNKNSANGGAGRGGSSGLAAAVEAEFSEFED